MERYTKRDAEKAFERLRERVGVANADEFRHDDPRREGAWTLDYNATYGGAIVHEIVADSPPSDGQPQTYSAVTEPLGSVRRSPREFVEAVNFAIRALNISQPTLFGTVDRIHRTLDGREWSSDTPAEIAEILQDTGYTIHPPGQPA